MRRARQTLRELQEQSASRWDSELSDLSDLSDLPILESDPEMQGQFVHEREVSEMTRLAQRNSIHGLPRGNARGNSRGSFWISGTTGKVLTKGKPFGVDGDQRWAKGMLSLIHI